jgi:hypothetical protein
MCTGTWFGELGLGATAGSQSKGVKGVKKRLPIHSNLAVGAPVSAERQSSCSIFNKCTHVASCFTKHPSKSVEYL